jgi:membrane protein implicated in regulation of membrane protease activity
MEAKTMGTSSQHKQLSRSLAVTLIVVFSFLAGVMTAAGTYMLLRKSGYNWMFELAMALFLLVSAASYARQLVRRQTSED